MCQLPPSQQKQWLLISGALPSALNYSSDSHNNASPKKISPVLSLKGSRGTERGGRYDYTLQDIAGSRDVSEMLDIHDRQKKETTERNL